MAPALMYVFICLSWPCFLRLEPSSDGMIPGRLVYEVAKSTFSLSAEDWSHGPKEQQLAGSEAFGRHAKYGPPYSSRSF
jgi:hypothetical protein